MTFSKEARIRVSLFIEKTKESILWDSAAKLKRQYYLSSLKEIASTYPETQLHIDKAFKIVEAPEDYDEKHQLIQDVQDSLLAFAKYKFPDIDFVGYIATVTMEKQETEAPEDLPEGFTRDPETNKIHPF